MRLAHLSDLHFGRHDPHVAGALVADLHELAPNLVVISGDFTQDGTSAEFAEAAAFLDALRLPTFCVPGNHDVPARNILRRLTDPYGLYRRHLAADLEPFLAIQDVAIAGLKTSRRWRLGLNWAHGSLSRRQLADLAGRFAASDPDAMRIVVAHHPLMPPETPFDMRVVKRADLALETFASLGVRLVLSGHFHLSYRREYIHGSPSVIAAPFSGGPGPLAPPLLVVQAGSAFSTRLRGGEPNAYNLMEIREGAIGIQVRHWTGTGWQWSP